MGGKSDAAGSTPTGVTILLKSVAVTSEYGTSPVALRMLLAR